jgi:drug/metabolite transporter (DMT)-like permease
MGSLSKTAHGASTTGTYHLEMPEPAPVAAVEQAPRATLIWAAMAVVYVIWSTTYLAMRVVNETLPTLLATSIRFLVAGAVLYGIAVRRGDRVGDRPTATQWRGAAIVAGLLLVCGNGGVAWGERTVPSGLAALVIATVPLWIAVIDRIVYHHRQPPLVIGGLVLGFAGAAILVGGSIAGHVDTVGLLTVVGASICWATGSLYQRRAPLPRRSFVSAGMQMLIAGGILLAMSAVTGEFGRIDVSRFSRASVLAVAYLIVFGSWLGFTSYLWLLRNARTSLVSTYAYVTPVGAVLLGALILNEAITVRTVVAGLLIVVAVAIIISAGGAARAAVARAEAGSNLLEERRAELETEVALEGAGGSQEHRLAEGGRGELHADGEPA